jgi:hypothetical protein
MGSSRAYLHRTGLKGMMRLTGINRRLVFGYDYHTI